MFFGSLKPSITQQVSNSLFSNPVGLTATLSTVLTSDSNDDASNSVASAEINDKENEEISGGDKAPNVLKLNECAPSTELNRLNEYIFGVEVIFHIPTHVAFSSPPSALHSLKSRPLRNGTFALIDIILTDDVK